MTSTALSSRTSSNDAGRVAAAKLATSAAAFLLGTGTAGVLALASISPSIVRLDHVARSQAVTAHGLVMVFLFLIPASLGPIGERLLFSQPGGAQPIWPAIDRISLVLYWLGAACFIGTLATDRPDGGWAFYRWYWEGNRATAFAITGSVVVLGLSTALAAVRTIASVLQSVAARASLLGWALVASAVVHLTALVALLAAFALLATEVLGHRAIFDAARGGNPILLARLFWLYVHPALGAAVLSALGIVGEIVSLSARRPIAAHRTVAWSLATLAGLALVAGAIPTVRLGDTPRIAVVVSALCLFAIVPGGLVVAAWISTAWRGGATARVPLGFAISATLSLVVGAGSAIGLGMLSLGAYLSGTRFAVAHAHYLGMGVAAMAMLGGLYHAWPRAIGRRYAPGVGVLGCVLMSLGVHLSCFADLVMGSRGLPRSAPADIAGLGRWESVGAAGTILVVLGVAAAVLGLVGSLRGDAPVQIRRLTPSASGA